MDTLIVSVCNDGGHVMFCLSAAGLSLASLYPLYHGLQETIGLSNDRKYLANRVITDSSHGTSIARRERIDLIRVRRCPSRCEADPAKALLD